MSRFVQTCNNHSSRHADETHVPFLSHREEESILKVIENDNDDDFEINVNESDTSRSNDEDLDSEEEERRERRRRAERRIHEEIMMEKINQCKELIDSVKKHTWKMSKKLDVLKKAKAYVEKFEGKLSRGQGYQQRGKQFLKQLSRSWKNGMASLVPWEMKIKQIEGHFGSVVASYFVFLRWLLWISVWLTILPTCFIMIPELIAGQSYGSSLRKSIPEDELYKAYDLQTIWNAEGVVKYSLIFYGYYGNAKTIGNGYRLPLAYLLINLASFAYSFVVVLKTMANNSRNSRMSNSDDEYTFAWKLFTEWDYMITNHDTATTKHASITTVFKETILEVKVKSRSENKWKILSIRIFSNISIALLLALSTYIIQLSVERSRQLEIKQRNDPNYQAGAWEENELTVVMTLISMIFPTFLDIFALIEKFHPRTSLQLMLGRIFVLNLLNLYTLFIALYNKQQDLLASITSLQSNVTVQSNCSTWLNTSSFSAVSTVAPTDVTTLAAVNVTSTVCVNVTNIPTKVKEFCWETMIGQEVFKLTVLDMVALIAQHLVTDVLRTYFVRYCNNLCCWDIEKNMPEYPEFKTAENLLHLISNQGVIWLGVLFCPGLALLNLIKLYILVYFRCWTVLCYNVPEERIFRASRSNNFYYALLLVMLFLCMLPPLFAIVVIEPSPQCGPFSGQKRMYHVLTETMETELPSSVNSVIQYAASPGVILPIFMLLGMTIYYLVSMGHSLKDANNELRMQLEYERTEGRRKVYAMADARHEPKGRTKGKGWHAARSSVVKKEKSLEKTAISVIQAMRPAKGGLAKSRVHPNPALSKLMENGSEAATNSGQSLMEKLRAAQKLQSLPVAVIKGKQSLKANTAATRERKKIAAQSAFQSALLEYARSRAQHTIAATDDDIIEDPSEADTAITQIRSNSTAKPLHKFKRAMASPRHGNSRVPSSRQEDDTVEDSDSQGEENTDPAERRKQSQNRFWGHSKTKQSKQHEVIGPRQYHAVEVVADEGGDDAAEADDVSAADRVNDNHGSVIETTSSKGRSPKTKSKSATETKAEINVTPPLVSGATQSPTAVQTLCPGFYLLVPSPDQFLRLWFQDFSENAKSIPQMFIWIRPLINQTETQEPKQYCTQTKGDNSWELRKARGIILTLRKPSKTQSKGNNGNKALKKNEISKPLSQSSGAAEIKTQPHLLDGHLPEEKTQDGAAKSKLASSLKIFEDEFKNIKILPRLKRLSQGKIPKSNVHSLSNENEVRKSQDGQTAHQDKELDLGDDETSPSVAALDNSEDENSDSAMNDSGEDDDDGMTPKARDDENKENLKKMLHKHIKKDDDSEKSETDSVQGDSENEDAEETGDEQNAFKETDTNLNERIRPKTNVEKSKDLIPASSQDNKKDHSNLVKTKSLNKAMRQKRSSKEENVTNSDHHLHTTKTQKNHEAFKTQRKMGEKEDLVIEQDDSNNVEDDLENEQNPTESEVNDNDATNSDTSEMDEDGSENDSFQNNNSEHDTTQTVI
ncbi:Transmembrane channel-like protein 3 [Bulinus truncatus]|nr:Transmembrane channel-like protein 3 [Bulinus truncatus]